MTNGCFYEIFSQMSTEIDRAIQRKLEVEMEGLFDISNRVDADPFDGDWLNMIVRAGVIDKKPFIKSSRLIEGYRNNVITVYRSDRQDATNPPKKTEFKNWWEIPIGTSHERPANWGYRIK